MAGIKFNAKSFESSAPSGPLPHKCHASAEITNNPAQATNFHEMYWFVAIDVDRSLRLNHLS